jgi:hypothetical protein
MPNNSSARREATRTRRRTGEESPHPFLTRSQQKAWTPFSLVHLLIQVFKMIMRKSHLVTLAGYYVYSTVVPAIVPKFVLAPSEVFHMKKNDFSNGRRCFGKRRM